MTSNDKVAYIRNNKKYISGNFYYDAYIAGLISVDDMYQEVKLCMYQNGEISDREGLMKEFNITKSTFYRHINNGVVKVTVPMFLRVVIPKNCGMIAKQLEEIDDDGYTIIASSVSNISSGMNNREYINEEMSPDYCRKVWSDIFRNCYTEFPSGEYVIVDITKIQKTQKGYYGEGIKSHDDVSTEFKWNLSENFIRDIWSRITKIKYASDTGTSDYNVFIRNRTKISRLSRYLELKVQKYSGYKLLR